jgi:hypothetical protein
VKVIVKLTEKELKEIVLKWLEENKAITEGEEPDIDFSVVNAIGSRLKSLADFEFIETVIKFKEDKFPLIKGPYR